MTLEEINNLISILEKNEHFKEMLNPNNNELENIYNIAKQYYNYYLNNNSNISRKDGIEDLKIGITFDSAIQLVKDFYKSLNIPDDLINEIIRSTKIDNGLERAYSGQGKITLGAYDATLGYIVTGVHEMAHCIRYYNSNKQSEGLINEIESKEIEEIFYKYLIDHNLKIIKDSDNKLRSLTIEEVNNQKLFEIEHDKIYIKRAMEEYEFIKLLRNNMSEHGSYQFTLESLNNAISMYGIDKINHIKALKENYLSQNPDFIYIDGYDVGNGRHLANEFRFVFARLITEHINNSSLSSKFGEYLMSSNVSTINDVMSYFRITSMENLVQNQISNYNDMKGKYLNFQPNIKYNEDNLVQLTPELESIFGNIKTDSQFSSSQLMRKYAELPEYQSLINRIFEQTKQLEAQVSQIRKNNPQLSDEMFFKTILSNHSKNIIETIKTDYEGKLTPEIIERLNKFSIDVINAPSEHGDMTAHSDISQVSINLAHFATDTTTLESKIVRAMGTMPHELFHFIFRMLKDKNSVDEKMVYDLSNGEQATVKGMVGHMLNEGFVEKLSSDFCQRNNIYSSPNPSYLQFTKLCEYIMKNNPNINEQFLIHNNYEGVLEKFSPEAREKYKETERTEYIGNFKLNTSTGEKRNISGQEVISSYNVKIEPRKQEETEQTIQKQQETVETQPIQKFKKKFDQRSELEVQLANQIKEKNTAIKEKKEQQKSLDKPKTRELTKTTNSGETSSPSGFINIVTLALISSFAISILNIIVCYICR
jgi:hypothetical protein